MDKYWGPSTGGSSTGTWDASSVTNWFDDLARTVRSAVAPTSADNVFFDGTSDAGGIFTVTIGTGAVCNDITAGSLDFTMTLAGSAAWSVYGSLTFPATNLTRTYTGLVTFRATTTGKTITTNGVTLTANADTFFDGVGGEWTLGSALTTSNSGTDSIRLLNGSLKTNGFNLTFARFISNYSTARALTLGASTLTSSVTGSLAIDFSTTTNFTFNAGTSSIICSGATPTFNGGGLTFYNVSFTSTSAGTATITGANTYNNLTFTSLAATGIRNISIGANQTVTGTLTLGTANTAIRRMFVRSDVVGTPRTITAATVATLADVDFRDIVGAGLGTWSGTRLGNCGGNTNITFDAPKTVYRRGIGAWSATQWSLSSGGLVDVNNFPLAQDTAIFDTGTVTGTHTIDNNWNIGTLDMSALNVAVTLLSGSSVNQYGNLILDNDVTLSGAGAFTFAGQGTTQQITSAGRTFTQVLIVNTTGTVQLQDALTTSNTFSLAQGTLDLNNFDLNCNIFSSTGSISRSILFGTKKIIITGNNTIIFNCDNLTNLTYTGTPTIESNYSGSVGTRQFNSGRTTNGGSETNAFTFKITAGSDIVSFPTTNQIFTGLDFTGFTGSYTNSATIFGYGDVVFSAGMTLPSGAGNLTFAKSSGTQTLTANGKTLDFPVTKSAAGTLQLLDACTIGSTRTLTHTSGTLDLNDFDLTTGLYSSTGSTTRQLDFGTGDLNITGATFTASGSNFTTAGTGSVSMNSASSKTFAGGGFSYKVLNQGGASELIITGANTFTNITNTNATASTITFPNVTTTVSDFTVSGSAGNLVTLQRTGASGTFTLDYTGSSATLIDYVSISNSTATPSSKFYAGVNSTDGGGNTGWTFNYTPTTMYWVNGSGTWSATSKTNWAAFSGSAGGNVVPTSSTNVIFDTNSDSGSAFTVTINNGVCNNLDASVINQTMTIDYNSKVLSVYGTTFTGASTGLIAKTGTGYIDMISASNKTFAGGGNIYGKIRNAGAGDLTITGANTFDDIANSTQPCTIKLPSGVVTKVVDFNLNGTFGNYVTLKSTTDGVQATLEYI